MYAPPDEIRAYLESDPKKPFILCEYMHDLGNSLGGLESYIRLSEEYPKYQGGFLWDYMDQALWKINCNGERVLGYGGDFGERQTDYAFSANGIVFADGTEKPAMQDVRYWYGSPEERARHDAANQKQKAGLSLPKIRGKGDHLSVTEGDGALGVRGKSFEVLFSYPEGGPVSLVSHGKEWLWRAPRPAYWRAPTENDLGCGFASKSSVWAAVDNWQVCRGWKVLHQSADVVSIRYEYTTSVLSGLKTEITYTVESIGRMTVKACYHGAPGRPELPLFGLRFATPVPVDAVHWLGLSGETYPDRKKGGVFGWHRECPQISSYLVPQECGCHCDTHAVFLKAANGAALVLEKAEAPFAFSALPYTPQQLEQAAHQEELPYPVRTVVTLCAAMRGVGGIDSWGSNVEDPYRVSGEQDQKLEFFFRL